MSTTHLNANGGFIDLADVSKATDKVSIDTDQSSDTKTPTKLAMSPSINGLWRERLRTIPDQTLIAIPVLSQYYDAFDWKSYTFAEVDRYVAQAAKEYAKTLEVRRRGDALKVVALLAQSDFDFVITELAIVRLGHAVLILSTNNSVAGCISLLEKTAAGTLIHSTGQADFAREIQSQMGLTSGEKPQVRLKEWLSVSSMTDDMTDDDLRSCPASDLTPEEESEETLWILHSSGSTGHPKPICKSSSSYLSDRTSLVGNSTLLTITLHHSMGQVTLLEAVGWGNFLYLVPQTIAMTPKNLVRCMTRCPALQVLTVPYVLKMIAEDEAALASLTKFSKVSCGGSPLSQDVGDKIFATGICLSIGYGSTEAGFLLVNQQGESCSDWRCMQVVPPLKGLLTFEERSDGLHELIVSKDHQALVMHNRPDGSYATSDLFRKHPTVPDGWLFVGRQDDTLVHINGEKTNPVPMEAMIRSSVYVFDALVVGHEQLRAAALIILSPQAEKEVEEGTHAFDLVCPAVEAANAEAPSHSRIDRDLIKILPSNTVFPRADKGSFIRKKTIAAFEDVIKDLYSRYETGGDGLLRVKPKTVEEALEAIRGIVHEAIGKQSLKDDEDFFHFGIDSLTANKILSALRRGIELPEQMKKSSLIVFDYPSISKLARAVISTADHTDGTNQVVEVLEASWKELVALHTSLSQGTAAMTERKTVILTGVTGGLGAHVLRILAESGKYKRIVCLCRAQSNDDAELRIVSALTARALPSLSHLQKSGVEVRCLRTDFDKADLGLPRVVLEDIFSSAAVFVHCAWPVNFNMSLASFSSAIRGAMILMALCKHHDSRFAFCSSVAAAGAAREAVVNEKIYEAPEAAMAMGYAQSKWVVEHLCQRFAKTYAASITVLRIGQIIGDTQNGIWNEKEAIPLMIKAGQVMKALPRQSSSPRVNWLPVDSTAWMLVQAVQAGSTTTSPQKAECVHIVHHASITWESICNALHAAGLQFDVVEDQEWLRRLQDLSEKALDPQEAIKTNPAIKLLDHFTSRFGTSDTGKSSGGDGNISNKTFSLDKMRGIVPDLEDHVPVVGDRLIAKMVEAWRESGFLDRA